MYSGPDKTLTREGAAAAIAAGGSVVHGGAIHTTLDTLPDDLRPEADDEPKGARSHKSATKKAPAKKAPAKSDDDKKDDEPKAEPDDKSDEADDK